MAELRSIPAMSRIDRRAPAQALVTVYVILALTNLLVMTSLPRRLLVLVGVVLLVYEAIGFRSMKYEQYFLYVMIEPVVYQDQRGFFMETWHAERFREAGLDRTFVQDNHSGSERNARRGLHYQLGRPQGKLVRVVAGEVFDVAVDLRCSSPTFGRWTGMTLSVENRLQLWVPEGLAHGYYVVSEWAEVIYKCTDVYVPAEERTLRWDDPDVGIAWPLGAEPPILSARDAKGLAFTAAPTFP